MVLTDAAYCSEYHRGLRCDCGFDRRATDPLTVTDDEPKPGHIFLPWSRPDECSIPWCKATPEDHPIGPNVRQPEPPRAVRQRRILAAVSTGAVLYGAHVSVWALPMLLGAVAGALLFLVWQPQDRLRRLVEAWR